MSQKAKGLQTFISQKVKAVREPKELESSRVKEPESQRTKEPKSPRSSEVT